MRSSDLGISWDSTTMYDNGGAAFLLTSVDLDEFKAEVEYWRGEPIEGDREAEADWERFVATVNAAKIAVHE
jgi:hypothetical protein